LLLDLLRLSTGHTAPSLAAPSISEWRAVFVTLHPVQSKEH
jgi:hypothetical protein